MTDLRTDEAWLLNSRFRSTAERTRATLVEMESLLRKVESAPDSAQSAVDDAGARVLDALIKPLVSDPPVASQGAEAAFTISMIAIVERRPLNVVDREAGDLARKNGRLAGDRSVGDRLSSDILAPRRIPATKGALQSSSFRSGYLASQARSDALRDFAHWISNSARAISEVESAAIALARAFIAAASELPPWPDVVASKLTFTAYLRAKERMLAQGSGGAFEQYLLAGLLEQEYGARGSQYHVTTKNVGATDRSSRTAGDIQVRSGQTVVSAIEVSAADWRTKIAQIDVAANASLRNVTIAAANVRDGLIAAEVSAAIDPSAIRLGVDPAVVDLHAAMDVTAARVTPHARAEAFHFVYKCLIRWHSREPGLARRLVASLAAEDLIANDGAPLVVEMRVSPLDVVIDDYRLTHGHTRDVMAAELRAIADKLDDQSVGCARS